MRQFVTRSGAADGLAGIGQRREPGDELLMRRCARNRLAGAGQGRQPGGQVYAGPVDVDAVAPCHGGVDAGAKQEMLILGDAQVLGSDGSVHFGGGIDGVGHRREARHQPVAKALDEDAAMPRQYFGCREADEIRPAANGAGFVLPHEPHRFHQIDQ